MTVHVGANSITSFYILYIYIYSIYYIKYLNVYICVSNIKERKLLYIYTTSIYISLKAAAMWRMWPVAWPLYLRTAGVGMSGSDRMIGR